jgi:hypothetical protein
MITVYSVQALLSAWDLTFAAQIFDILKGFILHVYDVCELQVTQTGKTTQATTTENTKLEI